MVRSVTDDDDPESDIGRYFVALAPGGSGKRLTPITRMERPSST